jgi:signal transduction histidine kinase
MNIYNDLNRIKQIIFNLISNAMKFTNPGGSITLKIKLKNNNDKVIYFSVKDTG